MIIYFNETVRFINCVVLYIKCLPWHLESNTLVKSVKYSRLFIPHNKKYGNLFLFTVFTRSRFFKEVIYEWDTFLSTWYKCLGTFVKLSTTKISLVSLQLSLICKTIGIQINYFLIKKDVTSFQNLSQGSPFV